MCKQNSNSKPSKCADCGWETNELFEVETSYWICSDCQCEAEAAAMDHVDYSDYPY